MDFNVSSTRFPTAIRPTQAQLRFAGSNPPPPAGDEPPSDFFSRARAKGRAMGERLSKSSLGESVRHGKAIWGTQKQREQVILDMLPSLMTDPSERVRSTLFYTLAAIDARDYQKGISPNEAELMLLLRRPDVNEHLGAFDRHKRALEIVNTGAIGAQAVYDKLRGQGWTQWQLDQELASLDQALDRLPDTLTGWLSYALTAPYDFQKAEIGDVSKHLDNWRDVGLLTHLFKTWKYDAQGRLENNDSLFSRYGFQPVTGDPQPTPASLPKEARTPEDSAAETSTTRSDIPDSEQLAPGEEAASSDVDAALAQIFELEEPTSKPEPTKAKPKPESPKPESKPRDTDAVYGKGFKLTRQINPSVPIDERTLIEFRRGYLLVSHPDYGTLLIRNSSKLFGRHLFEKPAYYSMHPVTEEALRDFNPKKWIRAEHLKPILQPELYKAHEPSDWEAEKYEHLMQDQQGLHEQARQAQQKRAELEMALHEVDQAARQALQTSTAQAQARITTLNEEMDELALQKRTMFSNPERQIRKREQEIEALHTLIDAFRQTLHDGNRQGYPAPFTKQVAHAQKQIGKLDQDTIRHERELASNQAALFPFQTRYGGRPKSFQPSVRFLLDELLSVKEDYRRWKFDLGAFNAQGHFEGYLSPGFPLLLEVLERWVMWRDLGMEKSPPPALAFVHPNYPIFTPYATFELTDKHIEEVKAFMSGRISAQQIAASDLGKFIQEGGLNNWRKTQDGQDVLPELVLIENKGSTP